jgi:tetratricopeptide (TPR) repeat protein
MLDGTLDIGGLAGVRAAIEDGDYAFAAAAAAIVTEMTPWDDAAWLEGIRAWRLTGNAAMAQAVAEAGVAAVPESPGLWLALGELASERGDLAQMRLGLEHARRLDGARLRQPAPPEPVAPAARIWPEPDGSEAVLAAMRAADGDSLTLEALAEALCATGPGDMARHAAAIEILRGAGLSHAAEAVAEDAMLRFGPTPELMRTIFDIIMLRGDAAGMLAQGKRAAAHFPDDPSCVTARLIGLREASDFAALEAEAAACIARFPEEIRGYVEHALAAGFRNDMDTALTRWARVRDRFPKNADGWAWLGVTLVDMGRHDEAAPILDEAIGRFPDDPLITRFHAIVAMRQGDWPEAIRRWDAAVARFPNAPEMREGAAEAHEMFGYDQLDAGVPPIETIQRDGAGMRQFFLNFESLGDNCEFGIVQRTFGAESLGLLRWATMRPKPLVAMLLAKFEGVGLLKNTFVSASASDDYVGGDKRYFSMHTFVPTKKAVKRQFLKQMSRRLAFLSEKLIADIESGSKIFVYKLHDTDLTDAMLIEIHEAMRKIGPATLLGVRRPGPGDNDLDVRKLRDGLLVGFIDALDRVSANDPRPYIDDWVAVCRRAAALAAEDNTD